MAASQISEAVKVRSVVFMGEEQVFTDKNGVRYRKHGVRSRLFKYSFRNAYFPVAEDDPKRFLYVTFFLGIFGGHKFMAGEYGKGILYLLTCGGFGVFYVCDVLNILTENYCITQVSYTEEPDGRVLRRKLRIYLDQVHMPVCLKGLALAGAVLIGVCSMKFGYTRVLIWADHGIEAVADSYAEDYENYGQGTGLVDWDELYPEYSEH